MVVALAQAAAPDWTTIDREIACPLCEYNLRGLADPRCPECGHQFHWDDVLQPEAAVRWLFEHTPQPGIAAFWRTFIRALWPWRFWRTVKSTHAVRPPRLWGFLFRIVFINLVLAMALAAYPSFMAGAGTAQRRSAELTRVTRGVIVDPVGWERAFAEYRVADAQGYLDKFYPAMTWGRYGQVWSHALLDTHALGAYGFWPGPGFSRTYAATIRMVILSAGWPILTLATFIIFRVSLRLAGVRWSHILRIVAYCSAVSVIQAPLWLAINAIRPWRYFDLPVGWDDILGLRSGRGLTLYLTSALLMMFLIIASRRYLRLPHAGSVAAASQANVILLLIGVGLYSP
jgi:hypothetical protein